MASVPPISFLRYYHDNEQPIKLVDRRKSWFMLAINFFLKLISAVIKLFGKPPLAKGDFLGNYVTTIGKTIYASPVWTWNQKDIPVVPHELTHRRQWGFTYAVLYLLSPRKRAFYESVAFQTEIYCFYRDIKDDEAAEEKIQRRATHLESYGIKHDVAYRELRARLEEKWNGAPQPEAEDVFHAWRKYEELGR